MNMIAATKRFSGAILMQQRGADGQMHQEYPRVLYDVQTMESQLIYDPHAYDALLKTGQYVATPAHAGIGTAPQQLDPMAYWNAFEKRRNRNTYPVLDDAAWQALAIVRNLGYYSQLSYDLRRYIEAVEKRQARGRWHKMLHDFQVVKLTECGMDELMAFSVFGKMLKSEYEAHDFEVPEQLIKRQKEVVRAIEAKLEDEIALVEKELKALEEKETKRQHAEARLAKLRKKVKA